MTKHIHICIVIFTLIVLSEQRPAILQEDETVLLEASRSARSIKDQSTILISAEEITPDAPKHLLKGSRVIRSMDSEDTTSVSTAGDLSSSEITTQSTESTKLVSKISSLGEESQGTTKPAVTGEPQQPLDFYGIFLKAVLRSPDEIIAKRSVDPTYGDEEEKNVEDLDTAANTVFRPLFVYRQQNAQRRRLRQLNVF